MHSRVLKQQLSPKVNLGSGRTDDRPVVLVVCAHNAGRSLMGEAFLNQMAGERYVGRSAGTEPAPKPHQEVIAAMREIGVELPNSGGTLLTSEMAESASVVVTMGCDISEACPTLAGPVEEWSFDDIKGKSPEEMAELRDRIEMRVRNLIARLDREADA